jgi:hypothetical protein
MLSLEFSFGKSVSRKPVESDPNADIDAFLHSKEKDWPIRGEGYLWESGVHFAVSLSELHRYVRHDPVAVGQAF